jgi:Fe-S-cluster containining protein
MRDNARMTAEITCSTCKACCCRLEVILMNDDAPPERFVETDRWGGQVMTRLEDGFCAALDRATHRCTIYAQRPGVCRDFETGSDDCMTERAALTIALVRA